MEGAKQTTGDARLSSDLLGTLVRSDGPGRHRVLLSGATPAYGAFVWIEPDHVGVVVDVTALDTLGGRYDTSFEQVPALRGVFDMEVGEKMRLADLVLIGSLGPDHPRQERPAVAPDLGATTRLLTDAEVRTFHLQDGTPRMAYHPLLAAQDIDPTVLDRVLSHVQAAVPEASAYVDLLRRESALRNWRRP